MTTAEKKRILSMPTVRGEIKFTDKYHNVHTLPFACHHKVNNGVDSCVMLRLPEERKIYGTDFDIYMRPEKDGLILWQGSQFFRLSNSVYLQQKIKWSDVSILWCTYQGIPLEQPAELQKAA